VSGLVAEAVTLLSDLIRARSCNPPGDEAAPARVLGAYLRRAGIAFDVLEAAPGRANIVARVRGTGGGPSLLLLSHLDTVDADSGGWSTDPWGGEVRDGSVWGRGALDLKGQAAAQAVAVASLLREGAEIRGDVILAATADEECGSVRGVQWLQETHPAALRADYALTHGAGDRVQLDDRTVYFCATAERAHASLAVTLEVPAALPMLVDNANVIVEASRFVTEVAGQHVAGSLIEEAAAAIRALTGGEPAPAGLAAAAAAIHPALATLFRPLAGATLVPTRLESSPAAGRLSTCAIDFDCWLLPGQDQCEVEQLVVDAAGGAIRRLEWTPIRGGSRSPTATGLWRAIETFVRQVDPGALLLPLCDAGMTDSHWLRRHCDTVAYGFFPMRDMTTAEAARCVHGPDERMPIRDLALQVDFYRHVVGALGRGEHD
jgi:acetylornithine deacetylase/succinyl-diaminopimelate desuccinylase-like protein